MDPKTKSILQTLIFAVLYLILFIILLPPLIKLMDEKLGKILYGVLVAGAVLVALRLRLLSRHLS